MADAQPFFLSRFNLWIREFRERAGLTDENYLAWCAERVALFRRYTLPSVLQQSHAGWRWLIWFDTEVNAPIRELLDELAREPRIVPILYDNRPGAGGKGCVPAHREGVAKHASAERVLTIRLDTDDSLHRDFLRLMLAASRKRSDAETVAFNFPFGCQLVGEADYRAFPYEKSPFLGVEEPAQGPLKTAFGCAHFEIDKHMPLVQIITREPMWLQTIHAGNAANEAIPNLLAFRCSHEDMARRFGAGLSALIAPAQARTFCP